MKMKYHHWDEKTGCLDALWGLKFTAYVSWYCCNLYTSLLSWAEVNTPLAGILSDTNPLNHPLELYAFSISKSLWAHFQINPVFALSPQMTVHQAGIEFPISFFFCLAQCRALHLTGAPSPGSRTDSRMRICGKSREIILLTESKTFDEDQSGGSRKCKWSWEGKSVPGLLICKAVKLLKPFY